MLLLGSPPAVRNRAQRPSFNRASPLLVPTHSAPAPSTSSAEMRLPGKPSADLRNTVNFPSRN